MVFFYISDLIHRVFVPPDQTVDTVLYLTVLERLKTQISRVGSNWQMYVPHSPYRPDLAPCDFFLFPKMKSQLKESHFVGVKETKEARTRVFNSLTLEDY